VETAITIFSVSSVKNAFDTPWPIRIIPPHPEFIPGFLTLRYFSLLQRVGVMFAAVRDSARFLTGS
jgi:hypothetical protein